MPKTALTGRFYCLSKRCIGGGMEFLVNLSWFFIVLVAIDKSLKYIVRIKNYYIRGVLLFWCWPIRFVFYVLLPAIYYNERRGRLLKYDFWDLQICIFIAAVNGEFAK